MSGHRILVVEDNPLNLKLVRDVLTVSGFEVVDGAVRRGGRGARGDLRPRPGADGPAAARHRRVRGAAARSGRIRVLGGVPVVAVTAFAMREDRERTAREGFDGYLAKPISVRALPAQVAEFLSTDAPMPSDDVTILAVDDQPQNLRLLDAVLSPRGYRVLTAASGEEALAMLPTSGADLVLLDIVMPGIDGYEVCRRIRSSPGFEFLPVVMITASGDQEKIRAIEAGADDFVSKPFNQGELLARVASLARVKRYHDTIERQAAELPAWNAELEARVDAQVEELQRVNRLRRFLSPQLVDLVIDSGDEALPRQPSPRDRRRLLRPARVHAVRRVERARGGDGGARRVPRGAGRADLPLRGHARALHRRRADGVLQRPAADRRRRPSAPSGWRSPCATGSPSWQRAGAGAATTWASGSASRRASPRSAGSGSRGASTTPPSAA